MISGTGEAPCAVLAYESNALPEKYLGRLLVASWADHRIEHYKITQPKDQGLVTTKREVLIQAENEFRPVDLAIAPDGTVYVTDWVSSSYALHKLGRIWRIRPKDFQKKPRNTEKALLSLHRPLREKAARELVAKLTEKDSLKKLLGKYEDPRVRSDLMQAWAANKKLKLDGLNDWLKQEHDVRLQQLGVRLLGERGLKVDFEKWESAPELSVKAAVMIAGMMKLKGDSLSTWRKTQDPLLSHAIVTCLVQELYEDSVLDFVSNFENLNLASRFLALSERRRATVTPKERNKNLLPDLLDEAGDPRFLAIKWIADERIKELRPNLVKLLDDPKLSYKNFRAVAAAIDRVDGKPPADHPAPQFLLDRITANNPPANLLRLSLREIDPSFKKLKLAHLSALLSHEDADVRLEALRTLARHPDPQRFKFLLQIANDEKASLEHLRHRNRRSGGWSA